VAQAILGVFGLAAATVILGWGYFRRYRMTWPPLGVRPSTVVTRSERASEPVTGTTC
jgi:hypothetical protein